MPFEVGQRVGDYEVQRMLGVGGMGHVYLVRNIISNRTEAMKVLLPDLTSEPDLAMRFISEIRTLAGFDHPNIAQLRTALQSSNQLVMIMEFVEGYTLEQIATQRRPTVAEVVDYVSQALSALGYAHQHGVIHRDIKPANLMVTSHGIVKLMDFGIAKSAAENINHTRAGTTIGSLHYMSPEQVRGGTVDARSDLYSIGIVLYELLAGRRPFEAETSFGILNAQLNTPPQPPIELNPELPAGLNQIILKALSKDPADRYQDAESFRTALKPFRAGAAAEVPVPEPFAVTMPYESVPTPPPAAISQPQPWAPTTSIPAPAASVPPPAFANVPTQPPPPQQQPQYAYPPPPQGYPPQSGSGNKTLWIATGAIAVLIALAGIGYAVPHYLHASAKSGADAAATQQAATAPPTPAPTTDSTPAPTPAPAAMDATPSATPATNPQPSAAPMNMASNSANSAPAPTPHNHQTGSGSFQQNVPGPGPSPAAPNYTPQTPPPAAASHAELDEAQERLMQVRARASAASHSVAQIRSQQEASGLGMRSDVESADSLLASYVRAADQDVQRGNAANATRDLDKADAQLTVLEKFLGH